MGVVLVYRHDPKSRLGWVLRGAVEKDVGSPNKSRVSLISGIRLWVTHVLPSN